MKRTLIITLIVILCASSIAFSAQATTNITVSPNTATVTVNGGEIPSDNFNYNGTIYVPLRGVFEKAGFNVGWDPGTKTAIISGDNDIDKLYAYTCIVYEYSMLQTHISLTQNFISKYSSLSSVAKQDLAKSIAVYAENSELNSYSRYLRLNDLEINSQYATIKDYWAGLKECADALAGSNLSQTKLNTYYSALVQIQGACVTNVQKVQLLADDVAGK